MVSKTILQSSFILIFTVFVWPGAVEAANYTVNTTSDTNDSQACTSSSSVCSLRRAIALANDTPGTDGIVFNFSSTDPFCTAGVCTIHITGSLGIFSSIRIDGPGADKLTIAQALTSGTVFFINVTTSASIELTGLTISGGNTPVSGGGGIIAGTFPGVNVTVRRCVVSGNTSSGGAISSSATMTIRESLVTGNTGDGIVNVGGDMTIINSTINASTRRGVENMGGTMSLTNSTVSNNGGISSGVGIVNTSGTFSVKGSIIARNGGVGLSDISGAFISAGFNLVGKRDAGTGFTTPTDLTGTILAPLDPKLDPAGPKNNGGPTKTIALLPGSPAIDKGSSNSLSGVLFSDQRGGSFDRTRNNPLVSDAFGGDGTDIGAYERHIWSAFDFDGDSKTDVGIFRPAGGEWWINRSSTGQTFALQFGASTDKIVPADYTGDAKADVAIWRPSEGNWYILRSEDLSFFAFPFGTTGDIPVPADYDGDGKSDPAIFRPSSATWFISQSGGGTQILQFGLNGDVPVVADYDGDNRADVGIFRNAGGVAQWWVQRSSLGILALQFGNATDKAVQGDYTGDGWADVAVWRPSTGEWFVLRSENLSFFGFPFGTNGDVPTPGDYDGDGRFDPTVFRPANGTWFSQRSTGGSAIQQFGLNADRPVANAFVP